MRTNTVKIVFVFFLLLAGNALAQQTPVWSTIARGSALPSNVPVSGYLFNRTADSTLWMSTGETWLLISSGFDISCNYSSIQSAKDLAVAAGIPITIPANCPTGAMTFSEADSDMVLTNYNAISITADDTIPDGAIVTMRGNGNFNISAGVNLHIVGKFDGGTVRRFYGDGTVTFDGLSVDFVRAEWFGGKSSLDFDSGPAFQKAIDAAPFGSTLLLMAKHGTTRLDSSGYLINTTVRIDGNTKQLNVVGAGSTIYSSVDDTILVIYGTTPGTDSFLRTMNLISGIRFKKVGTQGEGVALALANVTFQSINNCQFEGFNNGTLFLNFVSSDPGWTEHNYIESIRYVNNDTAILFNARDGATSSFRNNNFYHIAIAGMGGAQVVKDGGQAVGIAVIGTGQTGGVPGVPNIYQSTLMNVSMALADSCTGVYVNGRMNNIFAQISFENFGGEGTRSRAWHFGPNATNIQGWIHSDFATRGDLDSLIVNQSGVAPQHIYTQIIGQSNNQAHGNSMIWDDEHQMYIQSVISNNAISGFKPIVGDTQVVFQSLITNAGIPRFRYSESTPLEFRRIFPNDGITRLAPIRAHNIGQSRFVSDSTVLDVRNTTFVQFGSNTSTIDSLTSFKGGIAGQSLIMTFDDDSTLMANLIGGEGSGRLFLINNQTTLTRRGMKSYFICQGQSTPDSITGTFWREVFRQYNNGEDRSLGIGDTVGVALSAPGTAMINPVAHNVILDTYASAALDTATELTGQIGDIIVLGIRHSGHNILFQRSANFILESNVLLDELGDKLVLMAVTTTVWQKLAFVDSSGTLTVADITSVVAGAGLTGGGLSGDVTLNVIGSDGIKADADTTRILLGSNSGLEIVSGAAAVDSLRIDIDGTTLSRSSTGIKVPTGGITNTEIANNTIVNADINASAGIVGTKLATGTVDALQIASTAITPGSYVRANITVDADGRLTAASDGAVYIYKPSDESVTSSATMQNDDNFQFTVASSGKYAIEGFLYVVTNSTADFKMDFDGGTATETNFAIVYQGNDGAGSNDIFINTSKATDFSITAGTNNAVRFQGSIEVNAGGTFIIRFAQVTTDGVNTTVKRGSWVSLTPLP